MVNPRFVIKAVISGQRLNINVPLTVSGTVNYIGVEAKCTSEWDGCTIVGYILQPSTGYYAQMALIYDQEKDLYYFPNAERLTLSAGEWTIWFVGIVAESGQEKYRVTTETRVFTVYTNEFEKRLPQGNITLDEEAIARATDAQNKANLVLDLYNAGKLRGPKGDPGDPAEIGFVQASVDNTTDNPRCAVTVTENPENTYNMQFAFSGIKGAKGDTGATGPKGDTGPQGAPGRDGTDGRDGEDGRTIDDYVLVQAEQPTSETNKMWLKPTASEDPVMIPTVEEFQDVETDVNNLKSAFEKSQTNKDLWIRAGLRGTGVYANVNIRLASRRFDSNEFKKCRTLTGYAFVVAAWDANDVYIGKYDGTKFNTSSGGANLTEFDFTKYPDYSFVIAMLNSVNPSAVMTIEESNNCIFERNYLENMPNVVDAVSNYGIVIAKATNVPVHTVMHVPCSLKAGDTIFIQMTCTPSSSTDCACTAYNNGVFVKRFINKNLSNEVGCTVKNTLTADCNEIRFYSNKNYSYTIYKVVYDHVNTTIAEQVANNTSLAYNNESVSNISADSYGAQILGESAIDINKQFFQIPKMKTVLLDNNYKYFSVNNIKLIIDAMAVSGLNCLVLGFGGSGRGLCFELDDMNITSYGVTYDLSNCLMTSSGKYLTETDMETVISYARGKNIDIIPYFNMPGHFAPFLNYQPQFRYNRYDDDTNTVNIDSPQARDYAYKCAELYMRWFAKHNCKYWLFGADEFGDVAQGYYNLYNAGNYNYAMFINQIAFIAAKYRMIPLAWNDAFCIDGNPYPFINRKVPVLYWKIATTHGATPTQISANGNELINSSESIYWVANGPHVTEQQIRAFNVHEFQDGTTVANPIGACFCIWIGNRESPALDDDGDAITTAVLPLIRAFGETITPQFT